MWLFFCWLHMVVLSTFINSSTFLLWIWPWDAVMLLHCLPLESQKRLAYDVMNMCHTCWTCSWCHWHWHRLPDMKWHCSWLCFHSVKKPICFNKLDHVMLFNRLASPNMPLWKLTEFKSQKGISSLGACTSPRTRRQWESLCLKISLVEQCK